MDGSHDDDGEPRIVTAVADSPSSTCCRFSSAVDLVKKDFDQEVRRLSFLLVVLGCKGGGSKTGIADVAGDEGRKDGEGRERWRWRRRTRVVERRVSRRWREE